MSGPKHLIEPFENTKDIGILTDINLLRENQLPILFASLF